MRTWAVLTASVLVMVLGASQAQAAALNIGGRTYATTSLGLGDDYSFSNGSGSGPYIHTWSGNDDSWNGTINTFALTGTDSVDITGNMTFQSGANNGNAPVRVLNGGVLKNASGGNIGIYSGGGLRIGNNGELQLNTTGSGVVFNEVSNFSVLSGGKLSVNHNGTSGIRDTGMLNSRTIDIQSGANVAINNGGTLQLQAKTLNFLSGATLSAGAKLQFLSSPSIAGNFTLGTGSQVLIDSGATLPANATISFNGGSVTVAGTMNIPTGTTTLQVTDMQINSAAIFTGSSATLNLTGVINANADVKRNQANINITDGSTLNLTSGAANNWHSYGGSTVVQSGGQLRFKTAGSGITWDEASTLQIDGGGILAVDDTGSHLLTGSFGGRTTDIKDGASIQLLGSGSSLTINTTSVLFNGLTPTATLGFNILNNGGLLDIRGAAVSFTTLAASRTLDMRGASAAVKKSATDLLQSQLATVNGTLLVSNGFSLTPGTGTLTVSGTGTLGGNNGTIAGNVTVQSSGIIAPGLSGLGTLNVTGTVNLNNGSTFQVDVGAGVDNADKLAISGAATIGSGTGINLAINQVSTPNQASYVIATAASGLDTGTITVTGMPDGCKLLRTATQLTIIRSHGTIIMAR
jgi:fibronectin-binding autotransporter adhesin